MLRERGRVLLFAAALITALAVAGCGRDDFQNDPRPPVPAEVSVKIATDGVAVSPKEFGAGLVNFTVANLTTEPGTLAIHGPVDADTNEIPPAGNERERHSRGPVRLHGRARAAVRPERPAAALGPGDSALAADQPVEDRVHHQVEPGEADGVT